MLAVSLTDFSKENFAHLCVGALAVVGGYLAGFIVGMLAAKGFDRFVVRTESPGGLHKVVRHTCALIVAVVVALLYFPEGKGPGNGGDASGDGKKSGDTQATGGTLPTDAVGTPATKLEPELPKIQVVEAIMLRVYGGADVEPGTLKFFRIGEEADKVDLAGLKSLVRKKVAEAKGAKVAVVFDYAPTASRRTSGGEILEGAKSTLGAPLLTVEEYRALLVKGP